MLPLPVKNCSRKAEVEDESDAAKDEFDVSSSDDGGSFKRKTEVKKLGPTMAKEPSTKAKGTLAGDCCWRGNDWCWPACVNCSNVRFLKWKLSFYSNKDFEGEGVKKPAAKKAPAAKKKTSPVNSDSEGGQTKKKQKTGGRKVDSDSDDDDFVMETGSSTAAPRGAAGDRFLISDVLLMKLFP